MMKPIVLIFTMWPSFPTNPKSKNPNVWKQRYIQCQPIMSDTFKCSVVGRWAGRARWGSEYITLPRHSWSISQVKRDPRDPRDKVFSKCGMHTWEGLSLSTSYTKP